MNPSLAVRRARASVPSLAAGLLLGAALMVVLPRALGGGLDARSLCAVLLAGLLLCFVLGKCALLCPGPHWRALAAATLPAAAALGWWAPPAVLVLAAAAALYVALSRLLPLLRTAAAAGAVVQLSLLFAGAALMLLLSGCGACA